MLEITRDYPRLAEITRDHPRLAERTCAACPATSGHEKVISTRKARSGSSASNSWLVNYSY